MPLYQYKCIKCKHTSEKLRKTEDRRTPIECGECGGKAVMVTSLPSEPQFKGRGWTPRFHH